MGSYLMMLYVTVDQEVALKSFFSQQGWHFQKPDLSMMTEEIGGFVPSTSTQYRHTNGKRTLPSEENSRQKENTPLNISTTTMQDEELDFENIEIKNEPDIDDARMETGAEASETHVSGNLSHLNDRATGDEVAFGPTVKEKDFVVSQSDNYGSETENDEDDRKDFDNGTSDVDEVEHKVEEQTHEDDVLPKTTKKMLGEPSSCKCCGEQIPAGYGEQTQHICGTNLPKSKLGRRQRRPKVDIYCTQCGKVFATVSGLRRHELSHTKNDKYTCNACGYSAAGLATYREHMARHGNAKPFVCPTCGKTFKTKRDLNYHQRRESGDSKIHQCEECGKCFEKSGDLQQHINIHSGLKQERCDVCGKLFRFKNNMSRHKKLHFLT